MSNKDFPKKLAILDRITFVTVVLGGVILLPMFVEGKALQIFSLLSLVFAVTGTYWLFIKPNIVRKQKNITFADAFLEVDEFVHFRKTQNPGRSFSNSSVRIRLIIQSLVLAICIGHLIYSGLNNLDKNLLAILEIFIAFVCYRGIINIGKFET